jgi:tryptophan-rich sensory protein
VIDAKPLIAARPVTGVNPMRPVDTAGNQKWLEQADARGERRRSLPYDILMLGIFLIITFAAAATGAFAGPDDWYGNLVKPRLTPPNWVFGPVWTTLYFLMALAIWNVWRRAGRASGWPIAVYILQLLLNAAWTILFFGAHRPSWALVDIGLLGIAILWLIRSCIPISRTSAALLVPYLLWVSFAAYLNWEFVRLN